MLESFRQDNTMVSFIGSGNLAWHLAPALDNTDFAVREVYSRNPKHAQALVEKLYQADVKSSLDFSGSRSRIFVLAISDDNIGSVAQELILPDDAILVHTSGSQPLSILEYAATPFTGVYYPLQTFTKTRKLNFTEIPVFIESDDAATQRVLVSMAKAVSGKVYTITSQKRKALHVAAVFASNFVNHMLTLAQEVIHNNQLDFELLKPLIVETINKALAQGPSTSQTGPARRGDFEILDRHFEFLSNDESAAELYKVISQDIIDRYTTD